MTGATTGADRGVPKVRVLFGTERFSSQHSWSELTALMPGTVCIVGLGAVALQLARRLDPFEVRLIGVRRDVRRGAPPTTPDIEIVGADRIHDALKVIATAHNADLTTSYFRRAARALGETLAAQLHGRQPPNALNAPTQPRQIRPVRR